ncbi:OmpA family protein [Flavihumibacter sp.]|uniref:OmpA family protein n=1 Tax=Flavihumibacter sp. TaxID=1913981 RepID=UPI002FC7A1CB|nr:OmpA family protein [Flavihumibacter sediminis]
MKWLIRISLACLLFLIYSRPVQSQLIKDLQKRAEWKLKQKANQKVDEAIDKTVDGKPKKKDTSAKEDEKTKKKAGDPNEADDKETTGDTDSKGTSTRSFKSYSKFDFVAGEKLVVFEDFSKDAVGDFPMHWNTNAGGEVVTVEGTDARWLKLPKEGIFHPEFIKDLPENFTLEFDLMCTDPFSYYSTALMVNMVQLNQPSEFENWGRFIRSDNKGARFSIHPTSAGNGSGRLEFFWIENRKESMKNEVDVSQFHAKTDNIAHISIWRQNQRMRIYVDEEKVFDLPKAIPPSTKLNALLFALGGYHDKADHYLISGIRLAVGAPDTRHKLINEGKYSTTGILFDVNSDKIKPESYGTLKDLASVLKENESVKVKVIGHTDSDGDAGANMELSKKRAAAVKASLITDFGIDAGRIETDGKGASQPVGDNAKAEGKAQNRRVEFLKL